MTACGKNANLFYLFVHLLSLLEILRNYQLSGTNRFLVKNTLVENLREFKYPKINKKIFMLQIFFKLK